MFHSGNDLQLSNPNFPFSAAHEFQTDTNTFDLNLNNQIFMPLDFQVTLGCLGKPCRLRFFSKGVER